MSPRKHSVAQGVLPLLLAVIISICERPSVAAESQAVAPTKNSLGMTLIPISAGTFQMSSPDTEPNRSHAMEGKQVEVVISNPFFIGDTEVTQEQWNKVMGTTPWSGAVSNSFARKGPLYPAVSISWEEATAFCKALTESEHASGKIPSHATYSLPTEAQWEYACRAGTTTAYSFGNDAADLSDHAWWGGATGNGNAASERFAHEVKMKKANAWNLFDMHGNVSEWCLDGYKDKLPGGKDPLVPAGGFARVVRGGSWEAEPSQCRSASRDEASLAGRAYSRGFRVVLNMAGPDAPAESKK